MKKFCPILTIGFAPPKTGGKDLRMWTEACAIYGTESDQCSIKACAEMLTYISGQLDDNMSILADAFVSFDDEDEYSYNPISD